MADQTARRVRQQRQALGELSALGNFGMRDEAGQDTVEQFDVIGAEARRTLQEKLADAARGIGAALGVATTDDVVEFRDQRWVRFRARSQSLAKSDLTGSRALSDCSKTAISAATYGSHTIAY
ncbi:MAG: hypothetical protein JF604_08805 [Bradyrhizobium sp.]|nr:hypothetical protein [Bradyrhizobium sp.]